MKVELQNVLPDDIEKRSMQIIEDECKKKGIKLDPKQAPIIKRAIHTSADFDYAQNLVFSNNAIDAGIAALKAGTPIFTDTKMAYSGINKPALEKLGCDAQCFISDADVISASKKNGTTRSCAAIDKAAALVDNAIFVIGNAPTALVRVCELAESDKLHSALVVGVPVGFVNVIESKELILSTDIPSIVARGRKGGSNIAACLINALSYIATGRTL